MAEITLVEAVNLALARAIAEDDGVLVLGEDVGVEGVGGEVHDLAGVVIEVDELFFRADRVVEGVEIAHGHIRPLALEQVRWQPSSAQDRDLV